MFMFVTTLVFIFIISRMFLWSLSLLRTSLLVGKECEFFFLCCSYNVAATCFMWCPQIKWAIIQNLFSWFLLKIIRATVSCYWNQGSNPRKNDWCFPSLIYTVGYIIHGYISLNLHVINSAGVAAFVEEFIWSLIHQQCHQNIWPIASLLFFIK